MPPVRVMPRIRGPQRSLSARVFWLTMGVIMLVEVMILLPSLGRERQTWLTDRITEAHLAALSVASATHGIVDLSTRDELLRLSGTDAIRLIEPGRSVLVLPPQADIVPDATVDLAHEGLIVSTWRALQVLAGLGPKLVLVSAPSPLKAGVEVEIIVRSQAMAAGLRLYVIHIAGLSLIIALFTGFIVYLTLNRALVRPMRRLTENIAAFRADPEHALALPIAGFFRSKEDEIGVAAEELAAMQTELRAALWRNARLAALGTAVAKISHDLRNILTSALLVADRLHDSGDPAIRRSAETLIVAVERAADLVGRTLDFSREGPPPLLLAPTMLYALVEEAADTIRPLSPHLLIENQIDQTLSYRVDRTQIYRVVVNLMRNAGQAGAARISIGAALTPNGLDVMIADDGPGLPEGVLANLFRPFAGAGRYGGTGLGLAIARDLARAHGGDLELTATGPDGTSFLLSLPLATQMNEGGWADQVRADTRSMSL